MSADLFWMLLIVLLGWVVSSTRTVRLATLQAEIQKSLIARINTREEMQTFLDSMPALQNLQGYASAPLDKALEAVRTGVILVIAGLASWVMSSIDPRIPVGLGIIVTALGAGFLISGFVTRHLAQQWGLMDHDRETGLNPNAR